MKFRKLFKSMIFPDICPVLNDKVLGQLKNEQVLEMYQNPNRVMILENEDLLIGIEDVVEFLQEKGIQELGYIAAVHQYQRYNESLEGNIINQCSSALQELFLEEDDIFARVFITGKPTKRDKGYKEKIDGQRLAQSCMAYSIKKARSNRSSIEQEMERLFTSAKTRIFPTVTINLPELTDLILTAGKEAGVQTGVYDSLNNNIYKQQ